MNEKCSFQGPGETWGAYVDCENPASREDANGDPVCIKHALD